jgi:hypothetical protein
MPEICDTGQHNGTGQLSIHHVNAANKNNTTATVPPKK